MKFRASHILVNHEYEAKDILKKLSEGAAFDDLARNFSICPSGKDGGDLGEFKKGSMVPVFEKAVMQLMPDEISGIIRTQFGFHIIKRNSC